MFVIILLSLLLSDYIESYRTFIDFIINQSINKLIIIGTSRIQSILVVAVAVVVLVVVVVELVVVVVVPLVVEVVVFIVVIIVLIVAMFL